MELTGSGKPAPPGREQELDTDIDFSRAGRVNSMLARRLQLLAEVEKLARTLNIQVRREPHAPGAVGRKTTESVISHYRVSLHLSSLSPPLKLPHRSVPQRCPPQKARFRAHFIETLVV